MEKIQHAEMLQEQDQPGTQTSGNVANANEAATYEAAITETIGDSDPEEDAILPQEKSGGRNHFIPNPDRSRAVNVYYVIGDNHVLRLKKTSKSVSEGATIPSKDIDAVFGKGKFVAGNRTEVAIVLTDGTTLTGYMVVSSVRSAIYLPKVNLPEGFPIPTLGYVQPIKVVKMIVG